MQPGPWLRPARSYSPYKTRQTCQRDEATGQPRQTNQQTNSGTNQPPNATGGRKSLWRVCVCDVGAGGPLQSLVTLVSWHQAQPTKPTSIWEEQTKSTRVTRQEQSQQPQQEAKQRGNKQHTKTHTGSEAGRESQRTNRDEGEDSRRRPAAAGQRGRPGRQQGQEGGSSTGQGEGRMQL